MARRRWGTKSAACSRTDCALVWTSPQPPLSTGVQSDWQETVLMGPEIKHRRPHCCSIASDRRRSAESGSAEGLLEVTRKFPVGGSGMARELLDVVGRKGTVALAVGLCVLV